MSRDSRSSEPPRLEAAGAGPPAEIAADPFVRRVAETLLAALPDLREQVFARILREVPFYAQAAAVMESTVHTAVEEHLGQLLRGLAGREGLDFGITRGLARTRAEQGVPVSALLHAYRLAAEVVWEHLLAAGHAWGGGRFELGQVLDGAGRIWSLTNHYCEIISRTYDETLSDRARLREQERMLLLDALIDGRTHELGNLAEAARTLGLPERGTLAVVVAQTTRTSNGAGLSGIERLLTRAGIASAWGLRALLTVGIVALTDRRGSDDPLDHLHETLVAYSSGRAGVSPVFGELTDAHRHVHLAEIALGCVPPGACGATLFDDHPLTVLIAGAPDLAERSARTVLAPVLALPRDERSLLLETLRTWIDEGGSSIRAAQRLFCHRNTVRNRLQRIEQLTGRGLDDPLVLAEACLAVQALELLPALRGHRDAQSA